MASYITPAYAALDALVLEAKDAGVVTQKTTHLRDTVLDALDRLVAERDTLRAALEIYANSYYDFAGALVLARPSDHPLGANTYLDRGDLARTVLARFSAAAPGEAAKASGLFRKKPVVVEAVRWTGREEDLPEVFALVDFDALPSDDVYVDKGIGYVPLLGTLDIPTLEGTMTAQPGDWIIKGVQGEVYPCKSDIFAATYESVAPGEAAKA